MDDLTSASAVSAPPVVYTYPIALGDCVIKEGKANCGTPPESTCPGVCQGFQQGQNLIWRCVAPVGAGIQVVTQEIRHAANPNAQKDMYRSVQGNEVGKKVASIVPHECYNRRDCICWPNPQGLVICDKTVLEIVAIPEIQLGSDDCNLVLPPPMPPVLPPMPPAA